jgi:hypothetical protein
MRLLLRDLQVSRELLEESYAERRQTWEATILSRRDTIANHLCLNMPDSLEHGPTATSGVPNGYRLQNDMLHLIEAREAEFLETSGEEDDISTGRHTRNPTPEEVLAESAVSNISAQTLGYEEREWNSQVIPVCCTSVPVSGGWEERRYRRS